MNAFGMITSLRKRINNLLYKWPFTVCLLFSLTLIYSSSAFSAESAASAGPKRVLFVLAHPDDEILIAARMKQDIASGNIVDVIWLTRGDKAGDPVVRETESRAAMAFLGVPDASLHFLDFKDSETYTTLREAYLKVLEKAKALKPDMIFSDAWEGGNIDHDAANFTAEMTSRALQNHPVHYEFPLYNSYKDTYQVGKLIPRAGVETLYTPIDDAMVQVKLKILDMYPSQSSLLNVMKRLVSPSQLKKKGEPYRLTPKYDYKTPPTEGKLGYELGQNRHPHSFAEFREAVEAFEKAERNGK